MRLSILILTVPGRLQTGFPQMVGELMDQTVDQSGVEILGLLDNQTLTVGSKRNKLLDIATGDYITFIDDDDRVTSDYISEIMKALADYPGVDVINYDLMLQHGGLNKETLQ